MNFKMKCVSATTDRFSRLTIVLTNNGYNITLTFNDYPFNMSKDKLYSIFGSCIDTCDEYAAERMLEGKIITIKNGKIVDVKENTNVIKYVIRWSIVVLILGMINILINLVLFTLM